MDYQTICLADPNCIGLSTAAALASHSQWVIGTDVHPAADKTLNRRGTDIAESDLYMVIPAAVTGGYLPAPVIS